jgi:hypothetical protein
MSAGTFEDLLREALAPVEPPPDLAARLETTLTSLAHAAADELESWELSAMRDPRNWVRPVVAGAVGVSAGTALVLLRVRSTHRRRKAASSDPLDLIERTLRDVSKEARRLLDRD